MVQPNYTPDKTFAVQVRYAPGLGEPETFHEVLHPNLSTPKKASITGYLYLR